MKCDSVRKEVSCVTVCVLCTPFLCFLFFFMTLPLHFPPIIPELLTFHFFLPVNIWIIYIPDANSPFSIPNHKLPISFVFCVPQSWSEYSDPTFLPISSVLTVSAVLCSAAPWSQCKNLMGLLS